MGDLSEEQAEALRAADEDTTQRHPAVTMAARELVDRLLECLSPEDRLIIRLQEMEGCTAEEIKAVTGWPVPYIRVRAFRARGRLNQRYEALKAQGIL